MTSSAGPLTAFDLEPLRRLDEDGESVRIVLGGLEGEGLLTDDPDERSERSYLGDKPQGNFMSFGRAPTERHVLIEVDGPFEGRILGINVFAGGDYQWVCLARSLESLLQLEVELAKAGAYEFVIIPPRPDAPDGFLSADPAILERDVSQDQFDAFRERVASLAARFGGSPGTVVLDMNRPGSSG